MSRYDDSANERQTPFDEQLAALLARTANTAQPSPNLAQRVRQALTASAAPTHHAPRRLALGLPSLGRLVGPALVAALLTVFVLVFAAHGWNGFQIGVGSAPNTQDCPPGPPPAVFSSTHSPDHSVALGQSATTHNITITLLRGYADTVSTIVSYAVTPSAYAGAHASQATLTDGATGVTSTELIQTQDSPIGILIFPPLPQSQLGSPQRLTIVINNLDVSSAAIPPGTENQAQGRWAIPFTITPVAGTVIPVTAPAQTHDGVTITLEELVAAPAGGGLGGIAGGVRALYKISGLNPTTKLDTALDYPSFQSFSVNGPDCHNTLTLMLANGQKLIPGFISLAGANTPEEAMTGMGWSDTLTVGASGEVEAQALFYTPATPGKVTFAINTVSISEVRNFKSVFVRNAQGPWTFTVALQK